MSLYRVSARFIASRTDPDLSAVGKCCEQSTTDKPKFSMQLIDDEDFAKLCFIFEVETSEGFVDLAEVDVGRADASHILQDLNVKLYW